MTRPNPMTAYAVAARRLLDEYGRWLAHTMRGLGRALHSASWTFAPPVEARRHRRRCPTCNPYGYPAPLPIDGHAYARRRAARARRRRQGRGGRR